MRSFIAIEFPHTLQNEILKQTASWRDQFLPSSIRWVKAGNIHLTLKFLGEVHPEIISPFVGRLHDSLTTFQSFDLTFGKMEVMPTPTKPRIVWLNAKPADRIAALAEIVESAATSFGIAPEKRPFNPHITIGRVAERIQPGDLKGLSGLLNKIPQLNIPSISISAVSLFKSDLKSSGPIYSLLQVVPLK